MRLSAVLAALALAWSCGGDSPTTPAPTPEPPPRPTTVTVSPAAAELTTLGATLQLTAEVRDQNAGVMPSATVTWSSSAAAVARVDASGLVAAVGNGTATITATAGPASGSATVTVAQEVSAVAVTPAADTVVAGDTLRFSAEARDAAGSAVAGTGFAWASSDTLVAVVDGSGLVTGVGAGEVAVTATSSGVTGSAELTVVAPAPTTVAVTPDTVAFTAVRQTAQLVAKVRDQAGRAMASVGVSWSSADTMVAAVDSAGLVAAVGNGTATITATAGPASGSATVIVAQGVSAVEVTPAADTVVAGDTLRLSAEARDAEGNAVAGTGFAWTSSDTLVAVVDGSGLVTGVGAGEVAVTATSSGEADSAKITVVAPAPTTVTVTPDTVAFTAARQTAQLVAEVRDQAGRAMASAGVFWSSADTMVAAVDSAGLVTATGGGATTVAATAGEVSGEAVVTVMQSAGLVVFPAADTITPGDTLRLVAEMFDENGHAVEGAEFSWSSSNASVARVDGSGLVTGVAEGTASITAAAGGALGTAEITVEHLDRAALVALYEATDGPNWVNNDNWLTDAPLGEWHGVWTDAAGRVQGLDLGGRWDNESQQYMRHGLAGQIPVELASLANLEWLNLGANNLSGPIPPELGRLAHLTGLYLYANDLSGSIPSELGGLANLERLYLGRNRFSGLIPEFGDLANLTQLNLYANDLSGPIPPELGRLAKLTVLYLHGNGLSGTVPAELGGLANLQRLYLYANDLSGPIPESFLALDALERFRFERNTDVCAPGRIDFVSWLEGMETVSGPYCNESDVAVLNKLYDTSGGLDWTNSGGWLESPALEAWYGVTADSLGRVTALDLSRNRLAGRLPAQLGELARMTELRIADNPDLSGQLPLSLDRLALRTLHYAGTGLCAPAYTSFRDWLGAIPSHEGTGAECAPPTDREVLEIFYDATGGPDWEISENWLTDAPLGDWYGVETDGYGRVVELSLLLNGLTGRIPPELGDLANLRSLYLWMDRTTGPIPPELGNLADLRRLYLRVRRSGIPERRIPPEFGRLTNLQTLALPDFDLTGPIPPELGGLADLRRLRLDQNHLTGSIPPEFGNLTDLQLLNLAGNHLTGSIPPEFDNLADLESLYLANNDLSGPIPPELGNLADLESLYLGENELTGPVPPEFGGLMRLRHFAVQRNAAMSGVLPVSLTNLAALETFQTTGTALCPPSDAGFLEWLQGVPNRRVPLCEGGPAVAYLVQAVQSRDFPVPLVAGEEARLRVFVTADRDNGERLPAMRASFYLNGALAHVAEIPRSPGPIPTEVDEGSLATSANVAVPADVVQPGLEMVVEVDPDGRLDPALGVARRVPATGRAAVDVRTLPVLDLTVVPFLWTVDPDSTVLEAASGMAADPEGHELLEDTRTLLPVGALDVRAHEPVLTSTNNGFELRAQTRAIRIMEGGTGYWMGSLSGDWTGPGGASLGAGRGFFSIPRASTIAHELGHSLSLPHAPCGGAGGPDPAYPYPDGSIGVWGYDAGANSLVPPSTFDLMSYCDPEWISDYFFTKALHFRLFHERPSAAILAAREAESLLLWGGADTDGELHLNPAFVVDAPPVLPDAAGEHRITGRTADGDELFLLDFAAIETADGDGSSSFAFALPVQPGWAGNLASITLTGPGGSATLDGNTDLPMTILRDPVTGQVRAILRDLPRADAAAALVASQAGSDDVDVLFSRGIPDSGAWSR